MSLSIRIARSVALLASTATLSSAQLRSAPAVTPISPEISCAACRITVTRVATLGRALDPEILETLNAAIARDSRGRYYVGQRANKIGVMVYDERGNFLTLVGRRGQGPGEFTEITSLAIGPGDTLIVQGGNRLQYFSPRDHRYVRSVRVPLATATDIVSLPSGEIAVAGRSRTPAHAGFPIFVLDRDGSTVTPIPSVSALTDPNGAPITMRRLGPAVGNAFWAVVPGNYVVEHWSADGRLRGTYSRPSGPFASITSAQQNAATEKRIMAIPNRPHEAVAPPPPLPPEAFAPRPGIAGLTSDAAGRLWVIVGVPDADWHSKAPRDRDRVDDRFDTIIEVIDPSAARLLATLRVPFHVSTVLRDGYLASTKYDANDLITVTIYRAVLTER